MKNHKYTHKWYKPKDRKAIRQKRREHRQKVKVKNKEYEGGEIFTKDEVIVMLKELRFEIGEHSYPIRSYLVKDDDNNMVKGMTMRDINQVILNKISALRGEKDGKRIY